MARTQYNTASAYFQSRFVTNFASEAMARAFFCNHDGGLVGGADGATRGARPSADPAGSVAHRLAAPRCVDPWWQRQSVGWRCAFARLRGGQGSVAG